MKVGDTPQVTPYISREIVTRTGKIIPQGDTVVYGGEKYNDWKSGAKEYIRSIPELFGYELFPESRAEFGFGIRLKQMPDEFFAEMIREIGPTLNQFDFRLELRLQDPSLNVPNSSGKPIVHEWFTPPKLRDRTMTVKEGGEYYKALGLVTLYRV